MLVAVEKNNLSVRSKCSKFSLVFFQPKNMGVEESVPYRIIKVIFLDFSAIRERMAFKSPVATAKR